MSYGSRETSDGSEVRGDGRAPVQAGERIEGCTLEYIGFPEDQEGNPVTTRAVVRFIQPNGAVFKKTYFDSDQDWSIDKTNQHMLHIATKIMSEESYYAAIAGAGNFQAFFTKLGEVLVPAATGILFNTKVILRLNNNDGKYYPDFPNIPNFVEVTGTTPSTLSTNARFDAYVQPDATPAAAAVSDDAADPVF